MDKPKVGVGNMIIRDGKVLLGRRKGKHGDSTYGWAGGHLEFGEKLEECAKRETMEETGLNVRSLTFLCLSNIIEYETHYVDIEFLTEVEPGEPKLMEPNKCEEWNWFDLNDLPSPLFKAVELAINSYKKNSNYNA